MNDQLIVDFAGEVHHLGTERRFVIGREGDLVIDDNPYLHRHFLAIDHSEGLWWVSNVGTRLGAHLTDSTGLLRSSMAPGARSPLVFPESLLTFAAGSTAYEIVLYTDAHEYAPQAHRQPATGESTIIPTAFTDTQRLAVLALAEPLLRRVGTGASEVPPAVVAARRLGWTQTRFNRKLDNVCDKLIAAGVPGLRGEAGSSAANRRLQLVEYAVTTLLVTAADLPMLDQEARANALARQSHSGQPSRA